MNIWNEQNIHYFYIMMDRKECVTNYSWKPKKEKNNDKKKNYFTLTYSYRNKYMYISGRFYNSIDHCFKHFNK
jgi:hypothetical protein